MSRDDFRARLDDSCLALAWSLWTELGASGWDRRHADWLIDIEPLILFSAGLVDEDPRLRHETIDWCVRYGRFVSATRLKNLLPPLRPDARLLYGQMAATVRVHGGPSWPEPVKPPWPYEPRRRSRVDDFSRPALLALRLRALFGVGARAEVIRVLVTHPTASYSAADLAERTQYTKRNVAETLEALSLVDLVRATRVRNQRHFRLAAPDRLLALVGKVPSVAPDWRALFAVLSDLSWLAADADYAQTSLEGRAVRALALLERHEHDLDALGITAPRPEGDVAAFWESFAQWALRLADDVAGGRMAVSVAAA